MSLDGFIKLIQNIVRESYKLKNRFTNQKDARVNYACIFCQKQKEYDDFFNLAKQLGKIIKETPTGPIFNIKEIDTVSGKLKLLKIRKLDKSRPERGDADFTIVDYPEFKNEFLSKSRFKLIQRQGFEMIELADSNFNVKVYFSNPPLDKQLGLTAQQGPDSHGVSSATKS